MTQKQEQPTTSASDVIDSTLLANSTYYLCGEISEETIAPCVKWILHENLATKSSSKLLTLYINSQGGDLYEAFGLIDVMRNSRLPIRTIGVGSVMSAGFMIFICGTKGHRILGANTGVMCHQYSDQPVGKHHDLVASMQEGERCNQRMLSLIKERTNLTVQRIRSRLLKETDVFLSAEEAIKLGVADSIL